MELTDEMKKEMSLIELDKTYMPRQEKLPVVAYQMIKQVVSFVAHQHMEIKRLDKEVRELRKELKYERH